MKSNTMIFLFILFVSFTVHADLDCNQHACIAVVDAGSSGSRLHLYTYDLDQSNTPINIKEIGSKKIKPGLATLETNQDTVNSYLQALFSDLTSQKMPVYFYATAGMRLLPQSKQSQIYSLLNTWFANQSQWQLRSSKTIRGADEGLFGWLAVNYQLGRLNSNVQTAVGVLDIGGASVQISFPVLYTEGLNNSDIVEFDLYGRHRKLFTHSFLGLGQNEVTHRYLDASSCFVNEYKLPSGQSAKGNAYSCEKEISLLINNRHNVNQTVQPAIQANPMPNWFVLGGITELVLSKPFQFADNQFTNESLLEQANTQVCQQSWPTLNSQYANNEYLYGYCLFPAYYYALIVDGYGIQANQVINYLGPQQESDWTLGVVLNQKALT